MKAHLTSKILKRWSLPARRNAAKRPSIFVDAIRAWPVRNGFAPLVIGVNAPGLDGERIKFVIRVDRADAITSVECDFPSNASFAFRDSVIQETATEDFSAFIQILQDLARKGILKPPLALV